MENLKFDIMIGDKFFRTMRVPITFDMLAGYDGDKPIIDGVKLTDYVLKKRPTLKYQKFRICF